MANKRFGMLLVILPASVLAQPPVAQPNYLDEMAKIDAQIAYIVKQNELKTLLRQSSSNEGLPRIVSILVDRQGASAQILYGSGIVRWIKNGDVLAEGLRVLAITKSSVLVGGSDGKFALSFAAPQAQTGTGTASAAAPVGPLPPLPHINIPMPLPPAVSPPPGTVPTAPSTPAVAPNPVR